MITLEEIRSIGSYAEGIFLRLREESLRGEMRQLAILAKDIIAGNDKEERAQMNALIAHETAELGLIVKARYAHLFPKKGQP